MTSHHGLAQTAVALILAGLSLIGTIYMEYSRNDRENLTRIAKLEQAREDTDKKIDHIERQVDKLVEWAIGKK